MSTDPPPALADATKPDQTVSSSRNRSRVVRLVLFVLVITVLFIAGFFLPFGPWLDNFRLWVEEQGAGGAIWFGLLYVLGTVLFAPGSILTIGAGAIYGPLWGTILVSLSSTIGAACAFLVGRYLARDQVRAWIEKKPELVALDQAVTRKG